eukprot:GAFH01002082.1.p8 GENE.GAFH01002082.1~~GAFH01002082.1.p8  ORF type:complete len:52 (+),score=5.10 GAFH01002082.1:389-544(+)
MWDWLFLEVSQVEKRPREFGDLELDGPKRVGDLSDDVAVSRPAVRKLRGRG